MAAAIMVSTFGCVNGLVLAGARVYYAMALDGLFFARVGYVDPALRHPRHRSPRARACGLTSPAYSDLLDYVIFAVLLFYLDDRTFVPHPSRHEDLPRDRLPVLPPTSSSA
jgi:APA family basic amino acid/polyamine antiporter